MENQKKSDEAVPAVANKAGETNPAAENSDPLPVVAKDLEKQKTGLTEDNAKKALIDFLNTKEFKENFKAENLKISSLESSQIVKYILQTSTQTEKYQDEYVRKEKEFPIKLMESLGDCKVQSVFSDEMLGLPAINHYSDTDINKASSELIAKHSEYFKVSNVLNQRHEINIIPITKCTCTYDSDPFVFHVYGLDNKIYAPEYLKCHTLADPYHPILSYILLSIPKLTEDEAVMALTEYIQKNQCIGKSLKKIEITKLEASNTIRYVLQTFTETRSIIQASQPYSGEALSTTNASSELSLWDYPAAPKVMFENEVVEIEVPNTAIVKPCDTCSGFGSTACNLCLGGGNIFCEHCDGKGISHNQTNACQNCMGQGIIGCHGCNLTGRTVCPSCMGSCSLKCFKKLLVNFENHKDEYLKEGEDLPDELLGKCKAVPVFKDEMLGLPAINNYSDPDINKASYDLIKKHAELYATSSRILQQRHEITIIPVTKCMYNYSRNPWMFHVYGLDHLVYAKSFPNKCGCSIL